MNTKTKSHETKHRNYNNAKQMTTRESPSEQTQQPQTSHNERKHIKNKTKGKIASRKGIRNK